MTSPTNNEVSEMNQMTQIKNAVISARILSYVANGASIKDAFQWVLGPGYYDAMIEEFYHELRAKAAA